MTRVTIYTRSNGIYKGFRVSGHSSYSYAGQDIVCAGISVLVINTVNSIEQLSGTKIKVEIDERAAVIMLSFEEEPSKEAIVLIEAMILGVKSIIRDNGKRYVSLEYKEV